MTEIDEFCTTIATRIPNVHEMLSLCDSLGIEFAIENGKPGVKAKKEVRDEAIILAKLFKREPFRTEVLKAKLADVPVAEPVVEQPKEEHEPIPKIQPVVPDGATIVVADKDAYTDKEMRGPPYMWCYFKGEEHSDVWFHITDYPIPKRS